MFYSTSLVQPFEVSNRAVEKHQLLLLPEPPVGLQIACKCQILLLVLRVSARAITHRRASFLLHFSFYRFFAVIS
jgi:hypothetical protein